MSPAPLPRSQEISNVLREEILLGQYRTGERLPSERDLTVRFETSRGTVREAFKRLDQLGIVAIQPGGARVMPIEDCTLNLLGPLLDVGPTPNPALVDQALELGGALVVFAVNKAMANQPERTVTRARAIVTEMLAAPAEDIQAVMGPPRLIKTFAEGSDHLVLRLIMNGLRGQVVDRLQAVGFPPRHDPQALRLIAERIDEALAAVDTQRIANEMSELLNLIRESAQRRFNELQEVAPTP